MTTETFPPCPVCGGADNLAEFAVMRCFTCGTRLAADAWRRLADAAALAAAVGRLEGHLKDDGTGEPTDMLVSYEDGVWVAETVWHHHDGPILWRETQGITLAAALVALAGEVGE